MCSSDLRAAGLLRSDLGLPSRSSLLFRDGIVDAMYECHNKRDVDATRDLRSMLQIQRCEVCYQLLKAAPWWQQLGLYGHLDDRTDRAIDIWTLGPGY